MVRDRAGRQGQSRCKLKEVLTHFETDRFRLDPFMITSKVNHYVTKKIIRLLMIVKFIILNVFLITLIISER